MYRMRDHRPLRNDVTKKKRLGNTKTPTTTAVTTRSHSFGWLVFETGAVCRQSSQVAARAQHEPTQKPFAAGDGWRHWLLRFEVFQHLGSCLLVRLRAGDRRGRRQCVCVRSRCHAASITAVPRANETTPDLWISTARVGEPRQRPQHVSDGRDLRSDISAG